MEQQSIVASPDRFVPPPGPRYNAGHALWIVRRSTPDAWMISGLALAGRIGQFSGNGLLTFVFTIPWLLSG